MNSEKILIIVPTYNELENIPIIIPEIRKYIPNCHILVVDDSSPDGTAQLVTKMSETCKDLFLLVRQKKEGLGKAYISGFKWALDRDYELIFEMDADLSHSPHYLPDFLTASRSADLVIGSRYISGVNVINWPMKRLLISYCANKLTKFMVGIPVQDCTGGFKCFKRTVLLNLNLERVSSSGYSFQVEMNYHVWKKGYTIKEIPIIFTDRKLGVSKMSTKIIKEGIMLLWRLRFLSLFSK